MARQYYKDSTTGQMKPLGVKVEDTLPVGTEVDYDGQDIPEGWEEVNTTQLFSGTLTNSGTTVIGSLINFDRVVDIKAYIYTPSNYVGKLPFYVSETNYGQVGINPQDQVYISIPSNFINSTYEVTIEYKETTD